MVGLSLARHFSDLGSDVEFVLMRAEGELLDEARKQFNVIDLGVSRLRNTLRPLISYLKETSPDVLMAAMWPCTVIAPVAARCARTRTRVLVSEHASLLAQYRDYGALHHMGLRLSTAVGYRLADARVGVSHGVAKEMASLSFLSEDAVETIYNPVPASTPLDVSADEEAALWSVPHGGRILAVGRLKPVKNHALLLRAFALLDRRQTQLVIVGNGACEGELRRLAEDLGIGDRVVFSGFHADTGPFYRTADVFVLSSNFEGFGNVIVEALAAGTKVVSTDCPHGPSEILKGGQFGTLVPVNDAQALAVAVAKALDAPNDPGALQSRAAEFSPRKAAEAYLELVS